MDQWEEICLPAIGENEEIINQLNYTIKKMMENIADSNTDPTAVRQITLKIVFKP